MSLISIVVPVFHNAGSLAELLAKFREVAAANPGDAFEYIFVDDGSGDDSYKVLTGLAKDAPEMRVIKLSRNFGATPAILAGISQASGDAVAAISADLQDPPGTLNQMIPRWKAGNKVVIATRASREDPGMTAMISGLFYAFFRRMAIRSMPRHGFDFFLVDRTVADLIRNTGESNVYLMGLILWFGFTPDVIHYHRRAREDRHGKSKWTFLKKVNYFVDSFVGFSYVPIRLASMLGILMSIGGGAYSLVVLYQGLFMKLPVAGWASLMVVVLIVSGAQLFMIGILGEYLWRNLEESRRRPRFIIDRIVNGGDGSSTDRPANSGS